MCGNATASELYKALGEELREGLGLDFRQVGEPSYRTDESITTAELPHEQRAAIEAAIEYGYYQTPRAISLTELSAELNTPLSTLQYRLQKAEAWIIECFTTQSSRPIPPLKQDE